ncbi:HAD-IIA family hydrolase [Nocardioides cavernaquae]|uniref:HAD-IIA family hydrolase n=1 Tax=Nocardioides cavernaquae TaxID=2321396 RepID=A0A3A5HAH5_9ACTN|nr:HAD-IIA family hydrolase [Nocardioides cavernaquae]RJS46395.1 HAD-IIA family hydrolase [Nocardioides cavernaquae]
MPTAPLATRYDGLVCDLDGVVYRGPHEVPGAVETLNQVMADGMRVSFATNNASRPPDQVVDHLRALGLEGGSDGSAWSVVTSSQAAAAYIAGMAPPGSRVLAVGGPGVHEAIAEAGLVPVTVTELHTELHTGADAGSSEGVPLVAVLQGLGVDVTWTELAEIAYRTQAGLPWVAANLDIMLPTGRGPAPGNGALVAAVRTATGAVPHVVGKPAPDLYDLCRERLGCSPARTLACGDRLDTDIEGANAAGLDSLLVFTGAASLQDVCFASKAIRPTHVARDLTGLRTVVPRISDVPGDLVSVRGDGTIDIAPSASAELVLPAVVAAIWAALDGGEQVSSDPAMWRALEVAAGLA